MVYLTIPQHILVFKKKESHNNEELTVHFEKTTAETFERIIIKIYIKRTTGVDSIPSKMVKKT